jgi:hypothetical protein
MEFATLETAALAHVDDSYYYGAYCGKCKHSARVSLVKLRARLGDTFPLRDVAPEAPLSALSVAAHHHYFVGSEPSHVNPGWFDLPII